MTTLKIIHTVIVCGVIGIIAYFGFTFYQHFRDITGSVWERAIHAASDSATILWSRFVALIGLLVIGLSSMSELVGLPAVSGAIQQYLTPQNAAAAFAIFAIVSEIARRRTLPKE